MCVGGIRMSVSTTSGSDHSPLAALAGGVELPDHRHAGVEIEQSDDALPDEQAVIDNHGANGPPAASQGAEHKVAGDPVQQRHQKTEPPMPARSLVRKARAREACNKPPLHCGGANGLDRGAAPTGGWNAKALGRTGGGIAVIVAATGLAAMPAARRKAPGDTGIVHRRDRSAAVSSTTAGRPHANAAGKVDNIAYPDGRRVVLGGVLPASRPDPHSGSTASTRTRATCRWSGTTPQGAPRRSRRRNDQPGPGILNPFPPGAARNRPNRTYTVKVLEKRCRRPHNEKGEKYKTSKALHFAEEAARPNNELYAGARGEQRKTGQSGNQSTDGEYETELVVLRVYVPNQGRASSAVCRCPNPN